ncbi:MAG: hypothetical protein KDA96_27450, partial [Planctomycetaceae bacterium]|nr:hypothetical protein [Planctomycetaceae bacterium]
TPAWQSTPSITIPAVPCPDCVPADNVLIQPVPGPVEQTDSVASESPAPCTTCGPATSTRRGLNIPDHVW